MRLPFWGSVRLLLTRFGSLEAATQLFYVRILSRAGSRWGDTSFKETVFSPSLGFYWSYFFLRDLAFEPIACITFKKLTPKDTLSCHFGMFPAD